MARFRSPVLQYDWAAIAILVVILAVVSVPSFEGLAAALR
jgi:hypothetical protein